ncbi:MFS transporter [Amnibacterium endophyticum]|uniref:MFS transporter n=1 Tax=Amnibacterium endophyticum TaxID=2109337 RepID=A0ABW4LK62_9MICO
MLDGPLQDVGERAFRLTLAGTLVAALGQGLTLPFLVLYLHEVLGASLPLAGAVLAVAAVAGLAATTVGGPLGDRIGLGRLAALGLVVQAAGTALLATGAGVGVATLGVLLNNVGNGLVWPALNGLVAVQVPEARRSRAFALRFGLLNGGLGVGGLLSGWVVSLDRPASFHLVYGIDAASTAVFALLIALGLRRTPGFAAPDRPLHRDDVRIGGYGAVLRDRPFAGYLAVAVALGVFGYAQMNGPWAAFAVAEGGTSTRVIGFAFAANTAVIVVLQLAVERRTRAWRRSRLLVAAALLWTLAWLVTGAAALPGLRGIPGDVGFVLALAVFGLGETFYSPVGGALPNALASEHLRGRYNALAGATWPVGGFVGPPLAGLLLGGARPGAWIGVVAVGTAVTAAASAVLGRRLPDHVERPAADR